MKMSFDYLVKKNRKDLKVKLVKTEDKGLGVFATKDINKGETIAYYKFKVFRENTYESPTNFVYSFEVYKKNGEPYKRLIGDIDEESFPDPIDSISFWGPFINEPSQNQRINADIDVNLKENYENKTFSSPGESMVYKIVATKKIRPGEEILWYYGKDYPRNYKVGKKY